MSYCTTCGKENIWIDTGKFHYATGEHKMIEVCPTQMCGHWGIEGHDWEYRFFRGNKCRRCGSTNYDYD